MARVISGDLRGRHLALPEGRNTRPTTDRMKEALFGVLQFELEGVSFLDLFAGSGQVGIEAVSRGAESLVSVEKDRRACECIRRNFTECAILKKASLLQLPVESAVSRFGAEGRQFDMIFMDPPYDHGFEEKIGNMIIREGILSPGGWLVIESSAETSVDFPELEKVKEKTYQTTRFSFFKREKDKE